MQCVRLPLFKPAVNPFVILHDIALFATIHLSSFTVNVSISQGTYTEITKVASDSLYSSGAGTQLLGVLLGDCK